MSIISRHPGAPYEDGDVLSAGTEASPDELELDVIRLFNEFNGGIDDVNIKGAANIQGGKIAASSIPGDRIGPVAITNSKLANTTVPAEKIKDGEVWLSKLQENSVSLVERLQPLGVVTTPGEYVDVATKSIFTGKDPTSVLAIWSFSILTTADGTGYPKLVFRIQRGNTTVFVSARQFIAASTFDKPSVTILYMDTGVSAGSSVEYTFGAKVATGTVEHRIGNNYVTLLNLRR